MGLRASVDSPLNRARPTHREERGGGHIQRTRTSTDRERESSAITRVRGEVCASEAQGLLVDPPVYVASGLPFRGLGMSCLPLRPFLSLLSLLAGPYADRFFLEAYWHASAMCHPIVTCAS